MLERLLKLMQQPALLALLTPTLWSCSQTGRVIGAAQADLPLPQNVQRTAVLRAVPMIEVQLNVLG